MFKALFLGLALHYPVPPHPVQGWIPTGIYVKGPVCWKHEDRRYAYQALCTKFTEVYRD